MTVMFRVALWTALCVASAPSLAGLEHITSLPLTANLGGEPETMTFPDGSILTNTVFFQSKASALSVGRTFTKGNGLPAETAGYTDVFYVVQGAGILVDSRGERHPLKAGDIGFIPRGLEFSAVNPGTDVTPYIHFFASFETQPNVKASGPIEFRLLEPLKLTHGDFAWRDGTGRHPIYQGKGGVIVEAVQREAPQKVQNSPVSELMFVVSGSGRLKESGRPAIDARKGQAILVPKGVDYSLSPSSLRTLSIEFDQPVH